MNLDHKIVDSIKLHKLKAHPKNPRKHTKSQIDKLAQSIRDFKYLQKIVVDENYTILSGHGRKKALELLGVKMVSVMMVDHLSDDEKLALVINDNALTDLSYFDDDAIKEHILYLANQDFDISTIHMDSSIVKDVLANMDKFNSEAEIKSKPEQSYDEGLKGNLCIKEGDIVKLGNHTIMCGDSFNSDNIDKLLGGSEIDAIISDPPYGMNLGTDFSRLDNGNIKSKISSKKYDSIVGDSEPFDPSFFLDYFKEVKEQYWFGADYYASHLPSITDKRAGYIVWDKRVEEGVNYSSAHVDFTLSEYEMIYSLAKHRRRILRVIWFGYNGNQYEPENGGEGIVKAKGSIKRVHANQKPVRIYNKLIEYYLKDKHKNIFEGFLGSGSLLISCEINKKNLYAMEYLPHYTQLCIERWCDFTQTQQININGVDVNWSEYKRR